VFKGGVGAIGKGRGNAPVQEGRGGTFGDTTEPALGDSLGKKASDQLGSTLEEGATLGTKIGVGIAQDEDPAEAAAHEIANSASRIGVGAVGKAGLGRAVDGLTAKIPIKGRPRPDIAPPVHVSPPSPRPPTPVDPRPAAPAGSGPSAPAPAPVPTTGPAPATGPATVPAPPSAPASAPAPVTGPATVPTPAPPPAAVPATAPAPTPVTGPPPAPAAGDAGG
ncbi:hypothetical protein ACFWN1_33200, partial [Streptomyces sp. NPDC058459]